MQRKRFLLDTKRIFYFHKHTYGASKKFDWKLYFVVIISYRYRVLTRSISTTKISSAQITYAFFPEVVKIFGISNNTRSDVSQKLVAKLYMLCCIQINAKYWQELSFTSWERDKCGDNTGR